MHSAIYPLVVPQPSQTASSKAKRAEQATYGAPAVEAKTGGDFNAAEVSDVHLSQRPRQTDC